MFWPSKKALYLFISEIKQFLLVLNITKKPIFLQFIFVAFRNYSINELTDIICPCYLICIKFIHQFIYFFCSWSLKHHVFPKFFCGRLMHRRKFINRNKKSWCKLGNCFLQNFECLLLNLLFIPKIIFFCWNRRNRRRGRGRGRWWCIIICKQLHI